MTLSPNLRGIALMVLGMAGLAITDVLLKLLGGRIPIGQLMLIQGIGGTIIFGSLAVRNGDRDWTKNFVRPVVIWRNVAEVAAAASFLTALVAVPLSTLSAVLQANPLLVTLGAAIWLNAPVGPRRWAAICVGLGGVLIIIRPWGESFDVMVLFCIAATIALSARDLFTRQLPPEMSNHQAATYGVAALAMIGPVLMWLHGDTWITPTSSDLLLIAVTILTLPVGYFGVTAAMRVGDVAAVTPFRYSRIVFALILAYFFFDERPDMWTWIGVGIVVGSGLYTIWRENSMRRG